MIGVYKPRYEDLWFRRKMLEDDETMSYNHAWGGAIPFPEEDWQEWYDHWLAGPEEERFYRYVTNENGEFVGEIACHYDDELSGYIADVIIYAGYRGRGYGGQALDALCAIAKRNGITRMYDDIAADNPALGMFLRRGFTEIRRTGEKIILAKEL